MPMEGEDDGRGWLRGVDGRLRYGWRVGLFLAAQLAVSGLLHVLCRCAAGGFAAAPDWPVLLLSAGVGLPAAMLVTWLFRRLLDRDSFVSLGFGRRWLVRDVAGGLALGSVLVMLMAGAARWLMLVEWTPTPLDSWLVARLLLVAAGLAAAAMYEELLCRGYVQGNLVGSIGPVPAILVTSGLFALLHGLNPAVSPLAMANLLVAGVMLGAARQRFGSLWAPWALHFAWNLVMGPVLGVPVSGLLLPSLLRAGYAAVSAEGELLTGGAFGFEGGLLASAALVAATLGILIRKGRPEQAGSERPPSE